MKYLQYAFTGFFMILGALWYVPTMIWGYQTSAYTTGTQNGTLSNAESADAFEKIMDGPAPLAWWRNRSDLSSHYRLDRFTDDRTVHFEQQISIEEILRDDEPKPEAWLYGAYAAARAPAFYAPACRELLETIASACKTYHSEGSHRVSRNGSDRIKIESSLTYIPSYPMGDPTVVTNGKMRDAFVRLAKDVTLTHQDARREIFLRARDICAEVRAQLGNCVIGSVRFDDDFLRLSGSAAGVRPIEATVWFASYMNKDIFDDDSFDQIVDDIVAVLEAETG